MTPLIKIGATLVVLGGMVSVTVAQRLTGQGQFVNFDRFAQFQMDVKVAKNGTARGTYVFSDVEPNSGEVRSYKLVAERGFVDRQTGYATFSGRLVETNVPSWTGLRVQVWFTDGGRTGVDLMGQHGGFFFTGDPGLPWGFPAPIHDLTAGDLRIHGFK